MSLLQDSLLTLLLLNYDLYYYNVHLLLNITDLYYSQNDRQYQQILFYFYCKILQFFYSLILGQNHLYLNSKFLIIDSNLSCLLDTYKDV